MTHRSDKRQARPLFYEMGAVGGAIRTVVLTGNVPIGVASSPKRVGIVVACHTLSAKPRQAVRYGRGLPRKPMQGVLPVKKAVKALGLPRLDPHQGLNGFIESMAVRKQ